MIFNGKTTEEAINNGLKAFNIPREFVDIKELGQMYTPNGIEFCVDISFNMNIAQNNMAKVATNDEKTQAEEIKSYDLNVYKELGEHIKGFLQELEQVKKASKNTIESYERDLRQFKEYVDLKKGVYTEYTEKDIKEYLEYLAGMGKKEATQARSLASIKKLYAYLLNNNVITDTTIITMDSVHVEKKDNTTEKASVNMKILEVFKDKYSGNESLKICRDRALLEVLCKLNLKPTEIVSLRINDVDLINGTLTVKDKMYELDDDCINAIEKYITDARTYLDSSGKEETLFLNTSGETMSRQGFWKVIKFYEEDVPEGVELEAGERIEPKQIDKNFIQGYVRNNISQDNNIIEIILDNSLDIDEKKEEIRKIATSELLNAYDNNSNLTPLLCACLTKQSELALYLVDLGADVNIPDKSTLQTALHIAAANADIDLVYDLIERGEDVNSESKLKITPIMNAIAQLIMIRDEQKNNPEYEKEKGWYYKDVIEIFMEKGAELSAKIPKSEKTVKDLLQELNINIVESTLETIAKPITMPETLVEECVHKEDEEETKFVEQEIDHEEQVTEPEVEEQEEILIEEDEEEDEKPPKMQVFLKLKGKDLYKVLDVEEVDSDFTLKRAIEKVLEDKEGNINREKTLFIKDKIDFEYLDLFKTVQAIAKELPGLEIYASYTDIDFDPFYYMFYSEANSSEFIEGYIEPSETINMLKLTEDEFIAYVTENKRDIKKNLNRIELELLENVLNGKSFLNDYQDIYNKELLLEICILNESDFQWIEEKIRSDKQFVLDFIKRAGRFVSILEHLPISLCTNRQILAQLFLKNGRELENADKLTQWDPSLVTYACRSTSDAFEYAHPMLKKDKDFIYKLSKEVSIFEHVDDSLKSDYDFVYKLLEVDPEAIEYASEELRENKELAKRAISFDPSTLWNVSEKLRDDEDTVIYACLLDISALEAASDRLLNDKEFIKCVEQLTGKKFVPSENEEMNKFAEHLAKSNKKAEEALESLSDLMKRLGIKD